MRVRPVWVYYLTLIIAMGAGATWAATDELVATSPNARAAVKADADQEDSQPADAGKAGETKDGEQKADKEESEKKDSDEQQSDEKKSAEKQAEGKESKEKKSDEAGEEKAEKDKAEKGQSGEGKSKREKGKKEKPKKNATNKGAEKKNTEKKEESKDAQSKEEKKEEAVEKPAADKSDEKQVEAKQGEAKSAAKADKDKPGEKKEDAAKSGEKKDNVEKAAAEKESAEKKPEKKLDTLTIKKEPLKVYLTYDGVFEAQDTAPILVRPDEWSMLTILSSVEPGARVQRGDVVIALELEKIDRAISDLRDEQKSDALALEQAQHELEAFEKTVPLDLVAAARSQRIAAEDKRLFAEVDKPQNAAIAEFRVKQAEQQARNAQEELDQLEKMYKADDLTEETEKIVLERAHDELESANFIRDLYRSFRKTTLDYALPREEERVNDAVDRVTTQSERNRLVLPLQLAQKRLDLARMKLQQKRADERLTRLIADREAMTVKAPIDGIVYFGEADRGRWSGASYAEDFRRGSPMPANRVVMTIVRPRPMRIRLSVPEKDLHLMRAGISGTADPVAFPELQLKTIVENVGTVPLSSGSFDARLTVALDDEADALMPGMNCRVRLLAYDKKEAVAVPPTALKRDEDNEQKGFVFLVDKEGEAKKHAVTLGKRNDKQIEIVAGLSAGDVILKEPPKDDK